MSRGPHQKRGAPCAVSVVFAAVFVVLFGTNTHAATWYVDVGNTSGNEDGLYWATAFQTIQPAVDAAATGDEVWVAEGTYTGTGSNVVEMKSHITLYGGFAGGETTLDQRDWTVHLTTVDGEEAARHLCGRFTK